MVEGTTNALRLLSVVYIWSASKGGSSEYQFSLYVYISATAISLRDITSVPPAATATATVAVAVTAAATVAATATVATLLYDRLRGFGGERLFIRMRMHMPVHVHALRSFVCVLVRVCAREHPLLANVHLLFEDTHIRFMSLQWSLRISW
ncbi:hypothetical protein HZH68_016460 [Vespula germanica]|uniref:Uncharacterized protein n=1 Tax=Vespula germanica TaxID=30212 RepID=A0A834MPS0_VESGE|nr:hypothetical protein HZH68_016460 [Vespula germanica]